MTLKTSFIAAREYRKRKWSLLKQLHRHKKRLIFITSAMQQCGGKIVTDCDLNSQQWDQCRISKIATRKIDAGLKCLECSTINMKPLVSDRVKGGNLSLLVSPKLNFKANFLL